MVWSVVAEILRHELYICMSAEGVVYIFFLDMTTVKLGETRRLFLMKYL